jgi:hypothetical protein
MSKRIFIDTFFSQFAEFMNELIKVFPNDADFLAYKMGLSFFHKTNPTFIISTICEHVLPYEQTILAKNEDFFLKHDFKEYMSDDTVGSVILKLKSLWTVLTAENRECVWNYIILLTNLAKRCNAL